MKTELSIICAGLMLITSSCQDESSELLSPSQQEFKMDSRAVVPSYFNWETIDFMPTPSNQSRIDPPWHGQGALSYMYGEDVLQDIKASDGWELLYSKFDANATAPIENPYFILYNKYRGIMRVYFYLTSQGIVTSSYLENELSIISNKRSTLLNFLGKEFVDATETPQSYVQAQLKTNNGTPPLASNRWYMMQYELAYDPNISQYSYTDIKLCWNLNYHDITKVNIGGTLTGDISGTLGASSSNSGKSLNEVVKTAGTGAIAAIGSEYLEKNKISDPDSKTNNKLGMSNNLFNNITKGVNAALSSAVGDFPNAAIKFLSAIIGGSSTATPICLNLNAKMELDGTTSGTGAIPSTPLTFWLPGTMNMASAPNYIPIYNKPLGVINFIGKPDIIIEHEHHEDPFIWDDGDLYLELTQRHDYYTLPNNIDYSAYLIINPEIKKIATVTIEKQDLVVESYGSETYLYSNISINPKEFISWYDPVTSSGGTSPKRCGVRFAIRIIPHDGSPSSLILKTFTLNQIIHTTNYINGWQQ